MKKKIRLKSRVGWYNISIYWCCAKNTGEDKNSSGSRWVEGDPHLIKFNLDPILLDKSGHKLHLPPLEISLHKEVRC